MISKCYSKSNENVSEKGKKMKVIVVGGVAAGTKAAAKLKREDRNADIRILTKGKDISYAGCGLPYYVSGVIREKRICWCIRRNLMKK